MKLTSEEMFIYNINHEKLNKKLNNYYLSPAIWCILSELDINTIESLLTYLIISPSQKIKSLDMQYLKQIFEQENILWDRFNADSIASLNIKNVSISKKLIDAGYILISQLSGLTAEQLFYILKEDYNQTEILYKKLRRRKLTVSSKNPLLFESGVRLSTTAKNVLANNNIYFLNDIKKMSDTELLSLKGIEDSCLAEIRKSTSYCPTSVLQSSNLSVYNISEAFFNSSFTSHALSDNVKRKLKKLNIITIGDFLFQYMSNDKVRKLGNASISAIIEFFTTNHIKWDLLETHMVKNLDIIYPSAQTLIESGFYLLGDITSKTAEEIFYILGENYGQTKCLYEFLSGKGIVLHPSENPLMFETHISFEYSDMFAICGAEFLADALTLSDTQLLESGYVSRNDLHIIRKYISQMKKKSTC